MSDGRTNHDTHKLDQARNHNSDEGLCAHLWHSAYNTFTNVEHTVERGAVTVEHGIVNTARSAYKAVADECKTIEKAGCKFGQETAHEWNSAMNYVHHNKFLNGTKDFLIDLAAGGAGLGVTLLTAETGPFSLGFGAIAGADTYGLLHKLCGDKVTAGGLLEGAIDGCTGGAAGAIEKAIAKRLANTAFRSAMESTLGKVGLQHLEKEVSSLLMPIEKIKVSPTVLKELETNAARIKHLLGFGSNVARGQAYNQIVNRGLHEVKPAARSAYHQAVKLFL